MNVNAVPYIENSMQAANSNIDMYNMNLKDSLNMVLQKISEFLNLPNSDKLNSIDWSSIQSIFATIGITLIVIACSVLVLWLLRAIGLYIAAKNQGEKLAWLAFIPYGCFFITGSIVGDTSLFGIKIHKTEWLLPAIIISMCLPFCGGIASLLFILAYFGTLYRLYQKLCPSFAIIFLIFSIIIPILAPFFIFFNRNGNKKA